jgi:CMP-N-acetylneuraminic acid synthetase
MKNRFLGKNFLIVIPARAGSKGIKHKNIVNVNGKPLIEYTINFAKKLAINMDILVSTDSNKIAKISRSLGASCPFLRPTSLSTDLIGDMPVVRHALLEYEKLNSKQYEFVILLQPTSPIRSEKQIYDAIEAIVKNKYDSVISVSSVNDKYHPYKQFELVNNLLKPFSNIASRVIARQQLSKSYIRNGVVYVFTRSFALRSSSVFSKNSGCTIINEPYVNIDTINDLVNFKDMLQNQKQNK